jgi:hypothetical protein
MEEVCHISPENATNKDRLSRRQETAQILSFENAKENRELSEREAARLVGVPRSTLRDRVKRKASLSAPKELIEFFESPTGVAFLHRLVLASQVVITLIAPGSIRNVCTFLKLAGLNEFVASSYGYQQKSIGALEKKLGQFGTEELERLCEIMRPKRITILEDETFHPQICLVAIEAASGFIVLEMYAQSRDSKTWTEELQKALGNLDVTVVQATSDEAKALLKHHEKDLQVPHSPDLFHPQQDLHKGTSLPMARKVEEARKSLEKAENFTERLEKSAEIFENSENNHDNCSTEMVYQNIEKAKEAEKVCKEKLEQAQGQQESMKEQIRGLSESYHPFDLETGSLRSSEKVEADLEEHFDAIYTLAEEVNLSQRCHSLIDKAHRVLPLMVATIAFFHETTKKWVEELSVTEDIERFILECWIPGRYLELVAQRARDPEKRAKLLKSASVLMPSTEQIRLMLSTLCENDRLLVSYVVEDCAQLFQRSSSAVEGRNGQLSLFHHGHHRLPESKLNALTVIHNYMKTRSDGTTAAERLFGHKPQDVFQWLLENTEEPSRPSKLRNEIAA